MSRVRDRRGRPKIPQPVGVGASGGPNVEIPQPGVGGGGYGRRVAQTEGQVGGGSTGAAGRGAAGTRGSCWRLGSEKPAAKWAEPTPSSDGARKNTRHRSKIGRTPTNGARKVGRCGHKAGARVGGVRSGGEETRSGRVEEGTGGCRCGCRKVRVEESA